MQKCLPDGSTKLSSYGYIFYLRKYQKDNPHVSEKETQIPGMTWVSMTLKEREYHQRQALAVDNEMTFEELQELAAQLEEESQIKLPLDKMTEAEMEAILCCQFPSICQRVPYPEKNPLKGKRYSLEDDLQLFHVRDQVRAWQKEHPRKVLPPRQLTPIKPQIPDFILKILKDLDDEDPVIFGPQPHQIARPISRPPKPLLKKSQKLHIVDPSSDELTQPYRPKQRVQESNEKQSDTLIVFSTSIADYIKDIKSSQKMENK